MGDEDASASLGFDPAQVLGLRNGSRSAESRFGDVIPNFTRPPDPAGRTGQEGMTGGAFDQPAFTLNRGPASQMAY